MKKSPEKRGVHSGPKDASSAYLFFITVRVKVRVRVTELVYQIGFTTLFIRVSNQAGLPDWFHNTLLGLKGEKIF